MKTHIRPKSGIIAVTLTTPQGSRTVSTGCVNAADAYAVVKAANLKAVEVAAKANALSHQLLRKLVIGKSLTVAQAIDEWAEWLRGVSRSERTAENHLTYVKAWANKVRCLTRAPSEIKESHIDSWINAPDGAKFGSRTVRLAAVRSFFNFCSIRQYCFGDPSLLVRVKARLLSHEQKEVREKHCFTESEIAVLTSYLSARIVELMGRRPMTQASLRKIDIARFWYCAILIGRHAGLRLGDICSLEWECLKKPGKFAVWTGKHDIRVELDVDDPLFAGISAIPANSSRFCFPEQDRLARDPHRRSKLSVQFGRLLEACKIRGHSFHDLRHTRLTELVHQGMSLSEAAKVAGHRSSKTTQGYVHEVNQQP